MHVSEALGVQDAVAQDLLEANAGHGSCTPLSREPRTPEWAQGRGPTSLTTPPGHLDPLSHVFTQQAVPAPSVCSSSLPSLNSR